MIKNVYKTNRSRSDLPMTWKKKIVVQQIQRSPRFNSPIKVAKRAKPQQQQKQTIVTSKRNVSNVKLSVIAKKTTSIASKSVRTAYIHKPLQSQVPASLGTSKTPPSKLVQLRLPLIRDHATKENLTQKVTLRCKTPRAESSYSRSNILIVSEPNEQTKSRHPLQHMDVESLLSESARQRLQRLFNKLDTDHDGHLLYPQVQRCFPANLPRAQLTFFHVLYEIISNATYFGLQEFYATAIIAEIVVEQNPTLWNTFLDDVDFNYYHESIVRLLDEFNEQCNTNTGTINYENLLQLIMKHTRSDRIERIAYELESMIPRIKTMKINRLDFLALLPAIIYIQSSFNHKDALFRFRDNSILDAHIRQALLI